MAQVVSVVPTIDKKSVILNGRIQKAKDTAEAIEFFEGLSGEDIVLTMMGGPGQNLFIRAQMMGLNVQRIPWFALERLVPGISGASGEDRAQALKSAWEMNSSEFYPLVGIDETILMLRELTRVRLNVQEYRKMAQLQYQAAWRDLAPLFPRELMDQAYQAALVGSASKDVKSKPTLDFTQEKFREFLAQLPRAQREAVELRVMFADAGMIRGALQDEALLERRIVKLAAVLDIWNWLHPGKGAVLPEVKGLGPSLGGSLIGEIGDIKRFPTPLHLRSYARYGLDTEGRFPRRRKGEVSPWNRYLERAIWLWTTDQVARYDHVWRDVYYHYKWREMKAHPDPVRAEIGEGKFITKYTLGHLDKRAKRKTGSALLNYVWGLWTAGSSGQDVEVWFKSAQHNNWATDDPSLHATWDRFLNGIIAGEVANGLRERVKDESNRRRATQPQTEGEETKE